MEARNSSTVSPASGLASLGDPPLQARIFNHTPCNTRGPSQSSPHPETRNSRPQPSFHKLICVTHGPTQSSPPQRPEAQPRGLPSTIAPATRMDRHAARLARRPTAPAHGLLSTNSPATGVGPRGARLTRRPSALPQSSFNKHLKHAWALPSLASTEARSTPYSGTHHSKPEFRLTNLPATHEGRLGAHFAVFVQQTQQRRTRAPHIARPPQRPEAQPRGLSSTNSSATHLVPHRAHLTQNPTAPGRSLPSTKLNCITQGPSGSSPHSEVSSSRSRSSFDSLLTTHLSPHKARLTQRPVTPAHILPSTNSSVPCVGPHDAHIARRPTAPGHGLPAALNRDERGPSRRLIHSVAQLQFAALTTTPSAMCLGPHGASLLRRPAAPALGLPSSTPLRRAKALTELASLQSPQLQDSASFKKSHLQLARALTEFASPRGPQFQPMVPFNTQLPYMGPQEAHLPLKPAAPVHTLS